MTRSSLSRESAQFIFTQMCIRKRVAGIDEFPIAGRLAAVKPPHRGR